MAVEILMPELGESVHEGTVSRWLKNVGDAVKEDEPIVEIMTDKVNTELPSPASGVLTEILIKEGDPVKVFEAMGTIDAPSAASAAPKPVEPEIPSRTGAEVAEAKAPAPAVEEPASDGERRWYTPVVKAMMRENGLTEAQVRGIPGSGDGGRVTKRDVEAYLAAPKQEAAPQPTPVATPKAPEPKMPEPKAPAAPQPAPQPAGEGQELVPLVGMRKMIADHMVRSSGVPVVTTISEADVTNMVRFRELNKESFLATYGVRLTYTPFFLKALAESLAEFPLMNASLRDDGQIAMNRGVNLGVAVALGKTGEGGLIVPVIKGCEGKGLIEIAKELEGIAKKARSNSLAASDVQGGTFTLTNPGTYGALFGTPMINAPQAGILGAYAIKKQPVIVDDMIAIRSIMHLVLTYDHRIIDGMVAGKFLASVRDRLQSFDFFK